MANHSQMTHNDNFRIELDKHIHRYVVYLRPTLLCHYKMSYVNAIAQQRIDIFSVQIKTLYSVKSD